MTDAKRLPVVAQCRLVEAGRRTIDRVPTRPGRIHLNESTLLRSIVCVTTTIHVRMHRPCFSPSTDRPTFSLVHPVLAVVCGLLLAAGAPVAQAQSRDAGTVLPARFEANRIYVTLVLASGNTLHLFTDTGGGRYPILTRPTPERLGLSPVDTLSQGRRSIPLVPFPDLRDESSVPEPGDRALAMPNGRRARVLDIGDGMLGQGWFAVGLWTFDYGAERLVHHPSREGLSFDPRHTIDLAFQTDSTGRRNGHHPCIEATITDSTYSFFLTRGRRAS